MRYSQVWSANQGLTLTTSPSPLQNTPTSSAPRASRSYSSSQYPNSYQGSSRSSRSSTSEYTPVNYDAPGGARPEFFYGLLIDANNRPSEVLSRLSDAMFFYMDRCCDIPGLRGTGLVEPSKYAWMCLQMGASQEAAQIVEAFLQSFYNTANIPYRLQLTANNAQVPVLDRRGWLHATVFEARADPTESHRHWNKAISIFNLQDPSTNRTFPTPIPRNSFPLYADPQLSANYSSWRTSAIIQASRARSTQMYQQYYNAMLAGRRSAFTNPYLSALGAGTFGAGYTGFSGGGGGGSGSGGGGGDHASVMDTINTVGTLANTILGTFGGGGVGGGLGALGALGGLGGFGFS